MTTASGAVGVAQAQSVAAPVAPPGAEEQWEADYRVIAARCGSPAFEKSFSAQSRKAVAVGLVSAKADTVAVEKSIANLRRSSLTLVATSSDCPARLAQLKAIQQSRQAALGTSTRSGQSVPARGK
ncbi:hypothetical protein [Variovorax sp. PAMC 28711]|uniref:hypothetical protein n=1 Tax=Variovorax sp. PAMC 28711 TaxID=1795631 RepID=UPI00078EEC22|nr:hypothetical protein [Variovorax sp. PAMC 28711]AMM23500.1 hypothetical protein AX767_03365 [Variovorax sp. PAMC 28711]